MGTAIYSALEIAQYVIFQCKSHGHTITNLQLQKILYYIQGFFYAVFNRPLFSERIVAWRLGPVVEEVYRNYKMYASFPLEQKEVVELQRLSQEQLRIVDLVIRLKEGLPASQLVNDTHNESPWLTATKSGTVFNEEITLDSLRDHFLRLIQGGS